MKQYEQLNRGQTDAVMHTDGPCVVIAPPGSGKTKVLALRIGALIEKHGVAPKQILVLTFTRSAAEQMRERYVQSGGKRDEGVTFGTIHAVFFRILRESLQMGAKLDGFVLGQMPRILPEKEKRQILTAIVNKNKNRREQFPDMEQICAYISRRKRRMTSETREIEPEWGCGTTQGYRKQDTENEEENGGAPGYMMKAQPAAATVCMDEGHIADEIWEEYCDACRELGCLDFEDITDCCRRLLQNERNAGILDYWRDRYRYLLVDEFQDVSPVQFSVLRSIAAPKDNLFVVGDDDQSIYGFRGSDTKLMLALPTYYPGIRTCYLTINYRSGRKIVDAAKHLIAHNRLRYEKEITAGKMADGIVRIAVCPEKRTQSHAVCEALRAVPDNETAAVIVRTNAQAAEMERMIGKEGIRVRAVGGGHLENVYTHPVAKDVFAYLTLAACSFCPQKEAETVNAAVPGCADPGGSALPQDGLEALLRVVNKPYRAVSRQAVIASGGSIDALVKLYEGNKAVERTLRHFREQLQCLAALPPFAAFSYLCEGIGYARTLPEEAIRGGEARAEARLVLTALGKEAGEMHDHNAWLRAAADGKRISIRPKEESCRICVITMHACKGLEFDHVVLPALNEGVIPHKKAFLPEEIEEERRLLYVAMTRARKTLLMTCIHRQGDQKYQMSRFLHELIKH